MIHVTCTGSRDVHSTVVAHIKIFVLGVLACRLLEFVLQNTSMEFVIDGDFGFAL